MLKGFDESQFQTHIDFPAVLKSGREFVIARAVMGATGRDPTFQERVKQAETVGMFALAYGFAYVQTSTASEEAHAICDVADQVGSLHGLVLDTEGAGVPAGYSKAELTQYILDWADVVKARGYEPLVYMNLDFLLHRVDVPKLRHLKLWQAQYAKELTVVGNWHPTFWQYSETGTVPGISGHVDLDAFFGSREELAALCTKKKP